MQSPYIPLDQENILDFAELYISVFNQAPWNDGWSLEAASERLRSFAAFPSFFGIGHVTDGVPDGPCLGWSERWVNGWQFHLKEMCVSPDSQRRGIGGRVLSELQQRLRLKGISRVFLETGHAAPAKIFYERHGFKQLSIVSLAKSIVA